MKKDFFGFIKGASHIALPEAGRRSAFTLAEVLITLGIIGVVAAMTMPTLIANYKKQVYVNQLKKAVSTIEQGFQKMMADNGVSRLSDVSIWPVLGENDCCALGDDRETCVKFQQGLKKYFKYIDVSKAAVNNEDYVLKFLNVSNATDGDPLGFDMFLKFADGSWVEPVVWTVPYGDGNVIGNIILDVNGKKGPNMYGRDAFSFDILDDGRIVDRPSEDCRDGGYSGCYNRIVENGWKMDY